jgi:protein arginine N-methyltransferase 3
LVNYIRSEAKNGNVNPDVSSKAKFEDDKYLQPVLPDDAVLYSLDDAMGSEPPIKTDPLAIAQEHIATLESRLTRAYEQIDKMKEMQSRLTDMQIEAAEQVVDGPNEKDQAKEPVPDSDSSYFESYSYNGMFLRTCLYLD